MTSFHRSNNPSPGTTPFPEAGIQAFEDGIGSQLRVQANGADGVMLGSRQSKEAV